MTQDTPKLPEINPQIARDTPATQAEKRLQWVDERVSRERSEAANVRAATSTTFSERANPEKNEPENLGWEMCFPEYVLKEKEKHTKLNQTAQRWFANVSYSPETARAINVELGVIMELADSALRWSETLAREPRLQKEAIECVHKALQERLISLADEEVTESPKAPSNGLAQYAAAMLNESDKCFRTHGSILEAAHCTLCAALVRHNHLLAPHTRAPESSR